MVEMQPVRDSENDRLYRLWKNPDFAWRSASSAAIKPFISTQALAAEVNCNPVFQQTLEPLPTAMPERA
jgi:hypothetical protein